MEQTFSHVFDLCSCWPTNSGNHATNIYTLSANDSKEKVSYKLRHGISSRFPQKPTGVRLLRSAFRI